MVKPKITLLLLLRKLLQGKIMFCFLKPEDAMGFCVLCSYVCEDKHTCTSKSITQECRTWSRVDLAKIYFRCQLNTPDI